VVASAAVRLGTTDTGYPGRVPRYCRRLYVQLPGNRGAGRSAVPSRWRRTSSADPGASQVWIYVELVDPITVEHQHPEDGARGSLGQPAFELPEDDVFDPAPDLILIMHERRDSAGGGA
jgi:hypothetical protein